MAENYCEAVVMSLRIAWLGPWCEQSAIGAFGLEVVSEIEGRGHDVVVFRSETDDLLLQAPFPGNRSVRQLTHNSMNELKWSFDHVIANIGDHFGFHGAIPDLLGRLGATVIFHDGFIANLAGGYAAKVFNSTESLTALIQLTHGPSVVVDDTDLWRFPLHVIAAERPMLEWLARSASGCVTHSSIWADRLRNACAGPVEVIPLCYPDLEVSLPRPIGDTLTIATVGHVNPNKRADQVIRALASDAALSERCRYQLLGEIENAERQRLSNLADTLNVPSPKFLGRVSEHDLRTALAETDVIACLRHPVLEGGSASLITALLTARPTLVSHQAHYAEIPEGLVLPCHPGNEAPDVASQLRWILDNKDQARALGMRARQYALAVHVKNRYVDKLLRLAARATEISPLVRAATKFGYVLGSIGAEPGDLAIGRISRELAHGFPTMHGSMPEIDGS
jgi:hypothetical protein